MNKNTEAMQQYLADRTARSGAELRELTGTNTVLLPVTGEDKLYVAVGTLAGIAEVAGKSFDEADGSHANKAVLTDEQIESIWNGLDGKAIIKNVHPLNIESTLREHFARAIETAVLSHASKAPLAEKVACRTCGGDGGVVVDGDCSDCNGKGYDWEPVDAAPASADNPSTAGAE